MNGSDARPGVETSWVHLPQGSHFISAYEARPRDGQPSAGILLCHDRHGISETVPDRAHQHSYQTCEDLAAEGYLALCVDLFSRAADGHSLRDADTLSDVGVGLAYLAEQVSPAPIGLLGFCMGGRLALLAATHFPQVAACADFYGRPINSSDEPDRHPEHPMDRLHLLRGPVIAHFGADDASIPVEQAEQLDANLARLEIPHRVVVHAGAGHAFFNHTDGHSYRPDVAMAAWADTVRFFAETLKQPQPVA